MAEVNDESEVKPPPFVEVLCTSSGKIRRFSAGTEAGFAVNLVNRKLIGEAGGVGDISPASYIEAVKEGDEEPVSFGPNSILVNYGHGWKLQTVVESNVPVFDKIFPGDRRRLETGPRRMPKASAEGATDSDPMTRSQSSISFLYIAKILLAFILIFVFGAIFTLLLENLPQFILYINSSV